MRTKLTTVKQLENIFNSNYRKLENVTQFGQSIKNPNLKILDDEIDSLEILKELFYGASETHNLTNFNMNNYEGTKFAFLHDLNECDHINTCNWSSPLTNIFDFVTYEGEENIYLAINVQNGYSDARCGYSIAFLFKFEKYRYYEGWFNLFEGISSQYKSFNIGNFTFSFDMFREGGCFDVYNDRLNIDICDTYIGDIEDCKQWLKDLKYKD